MARKARLTGMEAIEAEIEKAEEALCKSKAKYDADKAYLKQILDKRDALRKDEVIKAIAQSKRSYEEILRFIKGEMIEDE